MSASNLDADLIYQFIPKDSLIFLYEHFRLDFKGIHGFPHWTRVIDNGYQLSKFYNDIDMGIIICFAFFHDIERIYDEYDYNHGLRGGEFFVKKFDLVKNIDDNQKKLIYEACKGHTHVTHSNNINISACWDSDRLDLMRVGIYPQSPYLNLEKSKEAQFIQSRSDLALNDSFPQWANDLIL